MNFLQICPSMEEFYDIVRDVDSLKSKTSYDLVTHGSTWISQVTADVPLKVTPAVVTDSGRYDAIMRGTFSDGSTWCMGGIEKSIDFTYFANGRTSNGTDGRIKFDIPNSRVHANFTGNGANITGLNASNLASGTVSDARFSSGTATATNNSTYVSGGSFVLSKKGKTVHLNVSGVAFKAYSGRQTVATVPEGYRPSQTAYGPFNGVASPYLIVNTNGTIQVDGTGSAHTNWGSACYVVP